MEFLPYVMLFFVFLLPVIFYFLDELYFRYLLKKLDSKFSNSSIQFNFLSHYLKKDDLKKDYDLPFSEKDFNYDYLLDDEEDIFNE